MNYLVIFIASAVLTISCNSTDRNRKKNVETNRSNQEKACMEKVIQLDDSLGEIRNHSSENISLSETITNYVNQLHKIEFENCPEDFTMAFSNHADAWLSIKPITDNYPEMRGELHEIFSQLENSKDSSEFNRLVKNIWATWEEVEGAMKASQD